MPKKLKVHPNERIDIPDFNRASFEYTQEALNFHRLEFVNSRRAEFLRGFRIELPDQTTSPGEITIHNGVAIDRNGELTTNENAVDDSRTITLIGANLDFYIEIEYTEENSDVDDRAIWDPTFDSGSGTLGREFVDSVTTKTTPTWKIVTPVSTAGFASTTDPSSTKMPLAILSTNGSGEITAAVNPGLVTEVARTVLEEPASIGDTSIRVVDSVIFPNSGGTLSVDGETVTLTGNDKERGILTFSGTPLAANHASGAIVFNSTVGAPVFIQERTTGLITAEEEVAATSTHPDKRRKFYMGDEDHGAAVLSSKVTSGDRDETQLRNLRDRIDSLAAVIQELKTGKMRATDTVAFPDYSATPSSARYFNLTMGSVQGLRSIHYTIGDGVSSFFGDFIGADHNPFQDAIDAAVAAGFEHVSLFVHAGTYTFTTPVSLPSSLVGVHIIGQEGGGSTASSGSVVLSATGANVDCFQVADISELYFKNITINLPDDAGGTEYFVDLQGTVFPKFRMTDCSSTGLGDALLRHSGTGTSGRLEIERCDFTLGTLPDTFVFSLATVSNVTGYLRDSKFAVAANASGLLSLFSGNLGGPNSDDTFLIDNCEFRTASTAATTSLVDVLGMQNVYISNSHFESAADSFMFKVGTNASTNISFRDNTFTGTGASFDTGFMEFTALVNDCYFSNCLFSVTNGGAAVDQYLNFTVGVDGLTIRDTEFSHVGTGGPSGSADIRITGTTCHNILVDGCKFSAGSLSTVVSHAILIENAGISNCDIINSTFRKRTVPIKVSMITPVDEFVDTPRLTISNNTVVWADPAAAQSTVVATGFDITNGNTTKAVEISIENNLLYGIGSTHVYGIQVVSLPTSFSVVRVERNTLSRFEGINSSSIVRGIWINTGGATSSADVFVRDNYLNDLEGQATSEGIRVDGPNNNGAIILRNKIKKVGTVNSAAASVVRGIFCDAQTGADDHVRISENTIVDLGNNSVTTGTVYGIQVIGNVDGWIADNNQIITARAALSSNAAQFAGIRGDISKFIQAHGNDIFSGMGIRVDGTSGAVSERVSLCNNRMDSQFGGIGVFPNGFDLLSLVIGNNVVNGGTTDSVTWFIHAAPGGGAEIKHVSVTGNIVRETATNTVTECRAICMGEVKEGLIITGNAVGTVATTQFGSALRAGIYIDSCTNVVITGNTVLWNPDATAAVTNQAEIYVKDTNYPVVSGNSLNGSSAGQPRRGVTMDNVVKYVVSNNSFAGFSATVLDLVAPTSGIPTGASPVDPTGGAGDDNVTG